MATTLKTPTLLDGATGTNLMAAGMPAGAVPELWLWDNPNALTKLHNAFIDAGSDIVYAPTFSANRPKLEGHGLGERVYELNFTLTKIAADNAAGRALVAGDLAPTGLFCEPFGELKFTELVDIYAEQAAAIAKAGAALFAAETMMSLTELRAALLGARKTELPVLCSVTVDSGGRTLSGTLPLSVLLTMQKLGAAAVGLNCSMGPDGMAPLLAEIAPYASVPLLAKPNAGLPDQNGNFAMTPDDMATAAIGLFEAGATVVGGCCGTTPQHIAALRAAADGFDFGAVSVPAPALEGLLLCDEQRVYALPKNYSASDVIAADGALRDALSDSASAGYDLTLIALTDRAAAEQLASMYYLLKKPLCLKTDDAAALEYALLHYQGLCAVDASSSIEKSELESICARYGAAII